MQFLKTWSLSVQVKAEQRAAIVMWQYFSKKCREKICCRRIEQSESSSSLVISEHRVEIPFCKALALDYRRLVTNFFSDESVFNFFHQTNGNVYGGRQEEVILPIQWITKYLWEPCQSTSYDIFSIYRGQVLFFCKIMLSLCERHTV